jgi:hypothetical protein
MGDTRSSYDSSAPVAHYLEVTFTGIVQYWGPNERYKVNPIRKTIRSRDLKPRGHPPCARSFVVLGNLS